MYFLLSFQISCLFIMRGITQHRSIKARLFEVPLFAPLELNREIFLKICMPTGMIPSPGNKSLNFSHLVHFAYSGGGVVASKIMAHLIIQMLHIGVSKLNRCSKIKWSFLLRVFLNCLFNIISWNTFYPRFWLVPNMNHFWTCVFKHFL